MSQTPPLPYCGAISLKELLEPGILHDPRHFGREDKKKDKDENSNGSLNAFYQSSALMAPSLWDNNCLLPFTNINDFKVELLDNDDFLNELNTITDGAPLPELQKFLTPDQQEQKGLSHDSKSTLANLNISKSSITPPISPRSAQDSPMLANALMGSIRPRGDSPLVGRSNSSSPELPNQQFLEKYTPDALVLASAPGEGLFNPVKRRFHSEELKPQPVLKKSKKTFVPEDCKDDKYWCRRYKNNTAAKRSRDAKRIKENQIALRAAFLEEENEYLKQELSKYKAENKCLKSRLPVD